MRQAKVEHVHQVADRRPIRRHVGISRGDRVWQIVPLRVVIGLKP